MTVLVVNNKRHLINEQSKASDKVCEDIINSYPKDAIVEFDDVKLSDVKPKTLKQLQDESINRNKK